MLTSRKLFLPLLALVVLIVTAGECGATTTTPPGSPSIDSFDAAQQGDTLTVDFNWTVSDPDGDTLECTLDVDSDGTIDYTISDCAANTSQEHSYASADTYTATLEVSEGSNTDSATTTVDLSQVVQCPDPERLTSSYNEEDRILTNRALPMQCVDYVVNISGFPKIYQIGTFGSNMTLTVEPGVVIAVADGQFIDVLGGATLVAEGTAELPIVFTGVTQSPGAWAGLRLNGEARLEHVTLEYAGSRDLTSSNYNDPANLIVAGGTLQMSNSTVRDGAGYGVFASNGSTITTFDNNAMTANALGAVSTDAPVAASFDGDNSYTGNTVESIFVNPRYGDVVGNATWSATDVPYVVTQELSTPSLFVGDGASLGLEPGVTIEFEPNVAFSVGGGGSVSAIGSDTNPILLTSVDASAEAEAAWGGFVLDNSASTATFDHVTVEYAGSRDLTSSNYNDPANLVLRGGTLEISNSTVRNSLGYGAFVQNSVMVPVFDNNTVTANALGAVSTDATPAYYFDANNDYTGNTVDKIFVNPRYGDIIGNVTWEAINVPFVVTNELSNPSLFVGDGNALTLAPGVIVEFEEDIALAVRGGRLTSEGTEQQQVTIRNVSDGPNFAGIVIDDGSGAFAYTTIINGGSVGLGYDDIEANVVITSFTGGDNLVGSATFGEGMQQSGAPFGLGFDNWGGSVGTTTAGGVGCSAMEPIYRPDPNDTAGQCN